MAKKLLNSDFRGDCPILRKNSDENLPFLRGDLCKNGLFIILLREGEGLNRRISLTHMPVGI